jgi:hypothetical protein
MSARVRIGFGSGRELSLRIFARDRAAWLAEPKLAKQAKAGGARRDRTDDLLLAKQALSQLSYGPVSVPRAKPSAVRREGWWAWEDLNFRPHAYQARALTN